MKLNAYLEREKLKDAEFAALVRCDRTTILRIRNGQKPSPTLMEEIARVTDGLVRPDDYFEDLPQSGMAA